MAGLCSSPWVKLLLAVVLSAGLPGNMGESGHPCSLALGSINESICRPTDSCTSLRLENLRIHALHLW